MSAPVKYRPEIDGLRCIAVLSVLIYHAELFYKDHLILSGGFIGVDIFFVISGYLITLILLDKIGNKNFSFLEFYERRARRILPALLVMMLATIPFAWLYLLPKAMLEYAGSGLSAIGSFSNIWFWLEDSYVAEPSKLKPLLHTWSLAVEEQFYIFFPIALVIIHKFFPKHLLALMFVAFIASLQLAQYGSSAHPSAAFYLLPTRIWELLLGSILAKIHRDYGRVSTPLLNQTMPILGLFLVLYGVFTFDDQMRHPSYMTAIPVMGVALLIWFARPGEMVSNMLASRPFVAVGLISYSLYLWHWPIFAYSRVIGENDGLATKFLLIAASLFMAILSYFWVERFIRFKSTRKIAFISIGVMLAVLVSFYTAARFTNGFQSRFGQVEAFVNPGNYLSEINGVNCFRPVPALGNHCRFNTDRERSIVLVGDSHAEALNASLYKLSEKYGFGYERLPDCVFIMDSSVVQTSGDEKPYINSCANNQINYIAKINNAIVVKAERLTLRMTGEFPPYGSEEVPAVYRKYIPTDRSTGLDVADIVQRTNETLLSHHPLVQIYPIVEMAVDIPKTFFEKLGTAPHFKKGRLEVIDLHLPYKLFEERNAATIATLDRVQHENYVAVRPDELFCKVLTNEDTQTSDKFCLAYNEQGSLYADDDHLSPLGSQIIVDQIEKQLLEKSLLP